MSIFVKTWILAEIIPMQKAERNVKEFVPPGYLISKSLGIIRIMKKENKHPNFFITKNITGVSKMNWKAADIYHQVAINLGEPNMLLNPVKSTNILMIPTRTELLK